MKEKGGPISVLLIICSVAFNLNLSAQTFEIEYYNQFSFELYSDIDRYKKEQIDETTKPEKGIVTKNYRQRAEYLKSLVNQEVFIRYDSMEHYLLMLFDRLESANNTGDVIKRVLIINSTETNAFSVGIKVITVTMGLLAQMKSENELIAVLAHEMVHELNGHSRIDALTKSVLQERQDFKKLIIEMSELKLSPEEIQKYQKETYEKSRLNRRLETEADTIGIRLLKGASYTGKAELIVDGYFNEGYYPSYGIEPKALFSPFYFKTYPFQKDWLLLDSFERIDPKTFLFFNLDSLETHPEDQERLNLNRTLVDETQPDTTYSTSPDFLRLQEKLMHYYFQELIKENQYDLAFHLLLYLYHQCPTDFVKLEIVRMLIKLAEIQNTSDYLRFVAVSDDHYPDDLKYVNAFLHNTSKEDKLWLTYYFLNRTEVFNKDVEDYYTLLISICEKIGKVEVRRKVEELYKQKFPTKNLKPE